MSPEQFDAMRRGRERRAIEQRQQAVEKIKAFRTWMVTGARMDAIPPVPRDRDYRAAGLR